jgi:hypothetical protein
LTFVLYFHYLHRIYIELEAGTFDKLADIFFLLEDYTNMSYYNLCGTRTKHSNISKRVGEGVITICVVLDQRTVIFSKEGGCYYELCGIEIKIVAMLCFISWLLICRVCSHPRRFFIAFQSPLLTNKAK